MKIKQSRSLLAVGAILIVCLIAIFSDSLIQGGEGHGGLRYEIKPQIIMPEEEYITDTTRVIETYERIIDRFMSLTVINEDIKEIAEKMVSIDSKLTDISARMARIEKALGIGQVDKAAEKSFQNPTHKPSSKSRN